MIKKKPYVICESIEALNKKSHLKINRIYFLKVILLEKTFVSMHFVTEEMKSSFTCSTKILSSLSSWIATVFSVHKV